MKIFSILLVFFLSSLLIAEDNEHFKLAVQFDSLSSAEDKMKLVDSILPYFSQFFPDSSLNKNEIQKTVIDILNSSEYKEGKAKVYMQLFSIDELKQLIELVQLPAFKLLQDNRYKMNQLLLENMAQLIKIKLDEKYNKTD